MKNLIKTTSILLAMVIITISISSFPVSVFAAETENTEESFIIKSGTSGDCMWELDKEGTLTISGEGSMDDYLYYSIWEPWNDNNKLPSWEYWKDKIKKVNIGAGVTNIGDSAFYGCKNLTSIEIPDSVTSIGFGAFQDCTILESIEIPDSVISIGGSAFLRCTSLNSLTIHDNNITSIGSGAFYGCTSLDSIIIPDSVTSIGDYAFYGCTDLKSIEIPDSVTSIGNYVFYECTSLKSIEIPYSVTNIGIYAFTECTNLMSLKLPYSVVISFDNYEFQGCTSLKSIIIPNSVTSIGSCAFFGCTSLESITIPNSVNNIGQSAFYGCTSLTNITIPNSVKSIDSYAFFGCTSLKSIEIPKKVTSIDSHTFYGCINLESLTIPSNVTSIGESAFCRCTSLNSITIPSSVKSIGEHAFGYFNIFDENTYEDAYYEIEDFVIRGKSGSEAQYYAEENGFTFITTDFEWKRDNWSFDNTKKFFSNYYVDDNTIEKIKEDFELNDIQVKQLKTEINFTKDIGWDGSCFGMTLSEILVNQGLLDLSNYGGDKYVNRNSYENKDIISFINVMQELQNIGRPKQNSRQQSFIDEDSAQYKLISKAEKILFNSDKLVMIEYTFKDTKSGIGESSHSVLGYRIDDRTKTYNNKKYDKRILIADPNHLSQNDLNEDVCIYYNNNDHSWYCPYRNTATESCYWNGSDNTDTGMIKSVLSFNSLKDIVDFMIGGSYDPNPGGSLYDDHYIAGISIYNKSGNQHTIEQVKDTGNPELNYTGVGSGIERYYIAGGSQAELYALWNPTADYTVNYSNPSNYNMKMDYENIIYYANVENGTSTLVKPDGSVNIEGSNTKYSITMLTDDSERVTDWYALTVSGNNTNDVTFEKQGKGYILSSDNLQNIEIKAEKGDVEAVKTFSTTYNSVFIYEIDENTIGIKVDVDGDGTYETELSDVQNTHQIGDVDFDSILGINDATAIQYHLAELEPLTDNQLAFADVDGDGFITINDATQLQKNLAGLTG